MRSRMIRIGIAAAFLIISIAIVLWIAAPRIAAYEAVKRAQALGLNIQIKHGKSIHGGYEFDGVAVSSMELPVDGVIDRVEVRLDGFHPTSISAHGAEMMVLGSPQQVRAEYAAWREKHPRKSSGQALALELVESRIIWKSPCGASDTIAENVQISNNGGLHGSASSVNLDCKGWEAQGKNLRANGEVSFDELRVVKHPTQLGGPYQEKVGDTKPQSEVHIPDLKVGLFRMEDGDQSAEAVNLSLKVIASESPEVIASIDSGSIDSPKLQTLSFGQSKIDLNVYEGPIANMYAPSGAITFNVAGKLGNVRGQYKAVTGGEAEVDDIQLVVAGTFDRSRVKLIITQGDLKVKDVSVSAVGEWTPTGFRVDATLHRAECQNLLKAIPDGMNNAVRDMVMTGTAEATLSVARKGREEPSVKLHYENKCKVSVVSDMMDRQVLRSKFKRLVPGAHGGFVEIESGPAVKDRWVPYEDLSPFLILAIQGTEDPGVMYHHGFIGGAIEQSIAEDITAGRFVRGASTVSMQLAKNLWLTREKTISRKIQEAFLTTYLEQTLSKKEILETYFNIVEFGPMVYGIREGAAYYFSVTPHDLTLAESVFLCSILSSPKQDWFDKDGNLSESRDRVVQFIMRNMLERKLITQAQYDVGSHESLTLHRTMLSSKTGDSSPIRTTPGGLDPDWSH